MKFPMKWWAQLLLLVILAGVLYLLNSMYPGLLGRIKTMSAPSSVSVADSVEEKEGTAADIYTLMLVTEKGEKASVQSTDFLKHGQYFESSSSGEIYYAAVVDLCEHSATYTMRRFPSMTSKNFRTYPRDQRYGTDGVSVYYNDNVGFDAGDCSTKHAPKILDSADPKTFEPKIVSSFNISQGNYSQGFYSRDAKSVFHGLRILSGVDPKTFQLTESVAITKDKNHIYLWDELIPKADPATYSIVLHTAGGRGTVYGRDKDSAFVNYCRLEGVDPESFSAVTNTGSDTFRVDTSDKSGPFSIDVSQNAGVTASCKVIR